MQYDVAIIGGGPAGSTAGAFLRKYGLAPKVLILERESFPRDHVGESQLPPLSRLLDEMGCWEKVEAAGFPIKVGATYRWGKSPELWDFDFLPKSRFLQADMTRPGRFEGPRRATAFQVDRAVYDKILLDHARDLGCEVREKTKVVRVVRDGDRVVSLELDSGEEVLARHYLDCSGHSGILRRAMGVDVTYPTGLQNIAIWDYWQNAEWAVEIGVGATRVQVMSLGYGWIWFIPLGPTRTSVGLVTPAEYFKTSGKTTAELYAQALAEDDRIRPLMARATSEGRLQSTKDWSFLASKHAGENWMLVGESAGFADPILAAGLTITQQAAKEAAFTILEGDRSEISRDWLSKEYERVQSQRVRNHIRFADYWYSANSQFADLKDFTAQIASENGLELSPEKAWAWLAQGGFIDDETNFGVAGFALEQLKDLGAFLTDVGAEDAIHRNNVFRLDLDGAEPASFGIYSHGRVFRQSGYRRGEKTLPVAGAIELVVNVLRQASTGPQIGSALNSVQALRGGDQAYMRQIFSRFNAALEAMIAEGWVRAEYDPRLPLLRGGRIFTGIALNADPPRHGA